MLKRGLRIGAGMVMLLIGLVGWALPLFPGWLFVIPGLVLLAREFHWARRLLAWLKARIPKRSLQD
ncbi:MAG: PGPGW domain-containing protein [Acidobacteria bacterium]|nr:PGPGW domain-containing protein [Acidobacteriota bacterium]